MSCLQMDPEARLSCEELKDHSYFDSYREEEMERERETTRTRIVGRGREQRSRNKHTFPLLTGNVNPQQNQSPAPDLKLHTMKDTKPKYKTVISSKHHLPSI
ncbi:hypothetical protein BSL78_27166 [Apostichopus japonicus]|uniref:Uncharacterized protein n=1 Tax=Stichopus japonicus TaxID=307972 RepID=A0A2G8JJT1_STIJA|nr:hypothetical protein BSL78_27166 [Apostichopus japonicus]